MKHYGRPFSKVTPELAAKLWAEYHQKPFNVSQRARELGLRASTISYHIYGGKISRALSDQSWCAASRRAARQANAGNYAEAAAWFREAAKRVEALKK